MGALNERVRVAQYKYEFPRHGGAVGTIDLGEILPIGAVVTGGMIHVKKAVTSGGAGTVALHLETAEDVLTAAAGAVANLTAGALVDVVPAGAAANSVLIVDDADLVMTIAGADLAAGEFDVHLTYLMPQN